MIYFRRKDNDYCMNNRQFYALIFLMLADYFNPWGINFLMLADYLNPEASIF
jgi:hypothetical protein